MTLLSDKTIHILIYKYVMFIQARKSGTLAEREDDTLGFHLIFLLTSHWPRAACASSERHHSFVQKMGLKPNFNFLSLDPFFGQSNRRVFRLSQYQVLHQWKCCVGAVDRYAILWASILNVSP